MRPSQTVVTIIAVFAALTMGLMIGASIGVDDQFLARQEAWITALEERFDRITTQQQELREELDRTQTEAEEHRQLAEELLLSLAAARIGELRLVVWAADDEASVAAKELTAYLQEAGAQTQLMDHDLAHFQDREAAADAASPWRQEPAGSTAFVVVAHAGEDGAVAGSVPVKAEELLTPEITGRHPVYTVHGSELQERWSLLMALLGEEDEG